MKKTLIIILALAISNFSFSQNREQLSKEILSNNKTIKILLLQKENKIVDSIYVDEINKNLFKIPDLWKDTNTNFVFIKDLSLEDAIKKNKINKEDFFIQYIIQSMTIKSYSKYDNTGSNNPGMHSTGATECLKGIAIYSLTKENKHKKISQAYFSNASSCYVINELETKELLIVLNNKLQLKSKIKTKKTIKKERELRSENKIKLAKEKRSLYISMPEDERKKEIQKIYGDISTKGKIFEQIDLLITNGESSFQFFIEELAN